MTLADLLGRSQPVTWLFTGDSVTAGVRYLHGHRDYTQLFAERIRDGLGRVRDVVVNTAVGGATIDAVAADLEHRALRFRPDVVFLGVGLNDTRGGPGGVEPFRTAYRSVVAALPWAIVVAQTPNGSLPTASPHVVPHLPAYAQAIRDLAGELDLPLVDHAAVWARADFADWIAEGCHPNEYGHRVMADTLFRTLGVA